MSCMIYHIWYLERSYLLRQLRGSLYHQLSGVHLGALFARREFLHWDKTFFRKTKSFLKNYFFSVDVRMFLQEEQTMFKNTKLLQMIYVIICIRNHTWYMMSHICYIIYDMSFMVYDAWCMMYDIWYMIYDIRFMIESIWYMIYDVW